MSENKPRIQGFEINEFNHGWVSFSVNEEISISQTINENLASSHHNYAVYNLIFVIKISSMEEGREGR